MLGRYLFIDHSSRYLDEFTLTLLYEKYQNHGSYSEQSQQRKSLVD